MAARSPDEREAMKKAFLAAYAECLTISGAARACDRTGKGRRQAQNHYNWMKSDPEYAKEFKAAKEAGTDSLVSECVNRARDGESEPIMHNGKPVFVWKDQDGKITEPAVLDDEGFADPLCPESIHRECLMKSKKSDVLLIFLLKAARPELYRDNYTAPKGGETDEVTERLQQMSIPERRAWINNEFGQIIEQAARAGAPLPDKSKGKS